ncbi:MAG: undecaprenyl-diphosphate phosphatase, partial [Flavobacteriales bacterium]
PTMFAATVKDLFDFYQSGDGFTSDQMVLLVIGNVIAFIVAMLAIRGFIGYLTRHGFRVFGYYRIVVGLALLLLYFLGIPLQMV